MIGADKSTLHDLWGRLDTLLVEGQAVLEREQASYAKARANGLYDANQGLLIERLNHALDKIEEGYNDLEQIISDYDL
jgi:hypothetical protein